MQTANNNVPVSIQLSASDSVNLASQRDFEDFITYSEKSRVRKAYDVLRDIMSRVADTHRSALVDIYRLRLSDLQKSLAS